MDDTGMEGKLLILNACRNNPFGRSWTRALNRGLMTIDASKGSLMAYSTSPGKTAMDGTGRNSPYTTHLLREIPQPRRPIELMFKAVRVGGQEETQVVSWDHLSLPGQGRATTPQLPRYGRRAVLPWPGSDARPAPHAGSSGYYARDRNCTARPRANSSSGDTVSLWKRPASCAPCADCASGWSRYAAPPHSY